MSSASTALTGFQRVTTKVLIKTGEPAHPTAKDPAVVIVNSWMGAALKHVSKYTAQYSTLYPSATIVVTINSAADAFVGSRKKRQAQLSPVLDAVRSAVEAAPSGETPKILVHNLSNGGNGRSVTIAEYYKERYGEKMPITALILDSCPGRADFTHAIRAFTPAIPKIPVVYHLGVVLMYLFFAVLWAYHKLPNNPDALERLRWEMDDERWFEKGKYGCKRLYVYSTADELIDWRDVEEHVEMSWKAGWEVEAKKFEDSKHVQHAHTYREDYWDLIVGFWEAATS